MHSSLLHGITPSDFNATSAIINVADSCQPVGKSYLSGGKMARYSVIIFVLLLLSGMFYSIRKKKLTIRGTSTGGLMAVLLFVGAGLPAVVIMGVFFLLASAATGWKSKKKEFFKLRTDHDTPRTASQVVANAGFPALLALGNLFAPHYGELGRFLIACCFASALSDTLSSELGVVYGKRNFNILTLKPDKRGLDGVVSVEGFFFGIAGSALIAFIFILFTGCPAQFLFIVVAGTAGNLCDSVLGASLERRNLLGNDAVNFLNTFIAACTGAILLQFQ